MALVVLAIVALFVWAVRDMRRQRAQIAEMDDAEPTLPSPIPTVAVGEIDLVALQESAPMPAIQVRRPELGEEPVTLLNSTTFSDLPGLAEQLILRGIPSEVTMRILRRREGRHMNEYPYGQLIIW